MPRETGGSWITGGLFGGQNGDYRYRLPGSGSSRAVWQANVANGTYEVFASWTAHPNRANNARFNLLDGATFRHFSDQNQQVAANDAIVGGVSWESLGTVSVVSGTLIVELSDLANGVVVADAIRIVG